MNQNGQHLFPKVASSRPIRVWPRLVVTLALLFALPLSAKDIFQSRLDDSLKMAWEQRGSAAAVVALYRAAAVAGQTADPAPLVAALERIESAPDAQPETRAHARELLRNAYRNMGLWDKALGLAQKQGFISSWLIIGPYSDDNKLGWDTFYDPERKLDFAGTYFGKEHEISWRRAPEAEGSEMVRLDSFLDPSEKVAGYAASFVFAERDMVAVVRGGYNEAYKLWLDGEKIGESKRYNGLAFDQFADGCTLRKGWNVLLVKVCNQESGWNFMARLTDASGEAIPGLKATSDLKEVAEPLDKILAKDGAPPASFKAYEVGASLESRAKNGGADAKEIYGEYLSHAKTFDRTAHPDADALRDAASELKDPWAYIALAEAEPDHNLQRDDYQKALALDPENGAALLKLGEYYLRRNMPIVGLRFLDRALAAEPGFLAARCARDRARLQFLTDGIAEADLEKARLEYPRSEVVQRSLLDALRSLQEPVSLLAALGDFLKTHQAQDEVYLEMISGLRSAGKTDDVMALYGECQKRIPFNREAMRGQALWLLALNKPSEARKVLAPAISWAPDWAQGQALMGDILLALGKRDEGLLCYQKAIELKPQEDSWKRKVAYLRPQAKSFFEAYRADKEDWPALAPEDEQQQAVILVDNTVIEVQATGMSSRYTQRVIRLMREGAARQMQYVTIPFDPDRQEVRVLEASIMKPDGTRIHADSFVTDALSEPEYRLYYRNRNMVLNFSGLQPGDTVWLEYLVSDVADSNDYGAYFGDMEFFAESAPVKLKRYTLLLPSAMALNIGEERLDIHPIVVTKAGQKIYSWTARDIKRLQQEPGMPGLSETSPYLHVSTFADWNAMGAWYAKFIQDQWEVTGAVRAQVAALVKGLSGDEEKTRAIHAWVAKQTRYVGLEFGVHGYKPYKVRQIFERRFGDCKDKALLMTAMLREAGLDACMVLVRTRDLGAIAEAPASLSVFNHAICYVPSLNLFLDGTAEYSGLHELPYQDQGVEVLLVWPDGRSKRVMTPVDKASDNAYSANYTIGPITASASAPFSAKVAFTGQECAWVRRTYQDAAKQREQLEKGLSNNFPGTKLSAATFSDLSDIDLPVSLEMAGDIGSALKPNGPGQSTISAWMGALDLSGQYGSLTARIFPLVISYPWTQRYTVTYLLPHSCEASPPQPLATETPFGTVKRRVTRDGEKLTVSTEITLSVRRVEPKDYGAFRDFCIAADQASSETVRLIMKGGRP
ncbi:MAG: DUF3857 domain-containing protein [Acidobacteria bacterium]|nr:DUF3857 domain-containing protein [Acidobacteriota bacterium]